LSEFSSSAKPKDKPAKNRHDCVVFWEGSVNGLISLSRAIDALTTRVGRYISWLILAAVGISTVNAIVRKLFDISSNAWLEAQWVLFGAVFLLCSPWTLLSGEHIRIDIVNSRLSNTVRNWIDLLGHAFFLMPFALLMMYYSWPFFTRSFVINEQSLNAGGLPQWPAKSLLMLGFTLLALQGASEFIKRLAIMRGAMEDTGLGGGHHALAEAEAMRLVEVAQAEADKLAAAKAAAAKS
jgi:TRAP-type mannitol/chloroaromatic compound transport system permease small subunit